jgi:hypothetical protein
MKTITKGIRVIVVFEYDNIHDPDSELAGNVTNLITDATDNLADDFGADRCYVSDTMQNLWVEE